MFKKLPKSVWIQMVDAQQHSAAMKPQVTTGLISKAWSDDSNLNLYSQPANRHLFFVFFFVKRRHKLVCEQASSKTEGVALG